MVSGRLKGVQGGAGRVISGRLLRTAIKDRAIVLVAINEFDRAVGLYREGDVAHHWPAANRHSRCASMLLPSRLVLRKVQTPTLEWISWAEIFT
jgi:hypothetical protein